MADSTTQEQIPANGQYSGVADPRQNGTAGESSLDSPARSLSIPLKTSEEPSADLTRDTVLSPNYSALHALPPRPASQQSLTTHSPHSLTQTSTPAPVQLPPRMRGGFEMDEDIENEEENEDDKDDVDVYDPAVGLDLDAPTPDYALPLDRSSQSPEQDNGITPVPVQATDNPADIPSPPVLNVASAPRTATGTPAPVAATAQASPPRSDVNGSVTSPLSKSRLAHDVVGILEDRITEDPRGDIPAYLELIDEFKSRNKQDDVRRTYDEYLQIFPMAAEQWCSYVRWEEEHDRKYEMEKIFNRSLLEVPDVQLWSIYINYIRRRNSMQSGNVANSYKIINASFDFALKMVGMDKDSGKLWQDYIDFLKSGPGVVGGTNWQDNQKMDTLREAYQKGLAIPTSALLSLWKEYDSFETGLSKINGRKFMQERSPAYMTARTAYTQLQNMTRDLQRTSRPRLPPAMGYQGDVEYAQQVSIWKQWIQWEKDDNVVIKDEDIEQYHGRILFTYKQALMSLQFWPQMWYDAAEFCFSVGKETDGMKFLTSGLAANPESALLTFKLADRIETSTSNDEATDPGAKARMKKVREPYDKVLDALYELVRKTSAREKADIQRAELVSSSTLNGERGAEEELNASNVGARRAAVDAEIEVIKKSAQVHSDLLSKIISHIWITLMRATRRVQGKGLPTDRGASGFRVVFNDARKKGKLTSDFYVETAQIEWQCYRDPTGTKILERGIKLFPDDDYLPLQYIKHLISINDVTNARAVFETTVGRFLNHNDAASLAKAKPLFAFFHDYESKFGELSQVMRLEERIRQHYPGEPGLQQFSERFTTPMFDPVNVYPIISAQQLQPKNYIHPSIETHQAVNSPIQKVIDSITTNSPKRPFMSDDGDDVQPRKLARGESPLKGAAGRRINQQQRQMNGPPATAMPHFAVPPPLPPQLMYLLSIIPPASTYVDARFDPARMVELIRDVRLPAPGSVGAQHNLQPAQQQPPPTAWPPQFQHHHQPLPGMPPGYAPPPGIAQGQYGGAPFRFA